MSMAVVARRRARLESVMAAQIAAAAPVAAAGLEVADFRVYPVREPVSGRSWSVVRVKTRSGVLGYGECAQASDADVAAARRFWLGRPATSYAAGPLDLPLAGAVDTALLDIAGKACKAPVYRLLGGPTRNKVRVFTSIAGISGAERTTAVKRAVEAGYGAVGVRIPEPAARNQGQAYQLELRKLAAIVQSQVHDFVLEGAGLLTPGDAASVAATIQAFHPLWFDEPCAAAGAETIRKIADETVTPLAFGREIRAAAVFQDLLRASCLDVTRPDIAHFGITQSRRIAALAETYYVAVAPRHEGGPIATAAALHLAASLPNFFIQQIPMPEAEEDRAMRAAIVGVDLEHVTGGFAALPTGPGLGITVNEAAMEKYHAA
jgi:galactonate dehydratase